MNKIVLSLILVILIAPLAIFAQPNKIVTEQCCKVGVEIKWKGKLGEQDCTNRAVGYCLIEKGDTVGSEDTTCSLPDQAGNTGEIVDMWSPDWPIICIVGTIYTVTNWIFFLMMALAVILSVIGGATYMLAAGDADKASKGKSIITFAIIGLAIALVARFIPPIVKFIMGVS